MGKSNFIHAVLLMVVLWMFTDGRVSVSGESHEKQHRFKTDERQTYELTIENVYYFHVSKYIPSTAEITLLKKPEEASYDTPEDAFISNISSLVAADYKWFQETFTSDARNWYEKTNKEHNRGREWWEEKWRKYYPGKRFVLIKRTESGEFVTITYHCMDSLKTEVKYKSSRTFEKTKDGKWLATRKLPPNDPISITPWPWPDGETTRRERRVIRE